MSDTVVDLDIIRPKKKIVKLNGKEFDVSFIPCGMTFEVDELIRKLGTFNEEALKDQKNVKIAFDTTVQLCSVFASYKYPELDENWFKDNVDAAQIGVFAEAIKESLVRSYKGVEQYGKN